MPKAESKRLVGPNKKNGAARDGPRGTQGICAVFEGVTMGSG